MVKKVLLSLLLLTGIIFTAAAGDLASFVNLGFSEDSQYFVFGQYGILQKSSKPYANLYIVNAHENVFVENGVTEKVYDVAIQPGQNGFGAMLSLISENNQDLISRNINFLNTGRLVYLLVNGSEPKSHLEFRDFIRGNSYKVDLVQQTFGEGDSVKASFHINLAVVDSAGNTSTYTIGLPNYKREGVERYRIKQVFFSPDESSLIFVVEKEENGPGGVNIRFMVETVRLN